MRNQAGDNGLLIIFNYAESAGKKEPKHHVRHLIRIKTHPTLITTIGLGGHCHHQKHPSKANARHKDRA